MNTHNPATSSTGRSRIPFRRASAALVLGACAAAAHAQVPLQPAGDQEIGVALRWQPVVDGTSKTGFDLVPLLDLSRDRWFARNTRGATEAGALLLRGESARVGVVLAYEAGRRASDVESLASRGVPDLADGVSYGPFVEWVGSIGPAPVSTVLRLRLHGDADRGSQADLRVTVGLAQTQRLRLGGFAQVTWADSLSMGASFGVDPGLAASSGLRPFQAGGGLRQASAGLLGTWRLTPEWALAGLVEARALGSSPVGSPLVTRRAGGAAVFGVTYAF